MLTYHSDTPNYYFLSLKNDIEKILKDPKITANERNMFEKIYEEIQEYEKSLRKHFKHIPSEKELRNYLLTKKELTPFEKNIVEMYKNHDTDISNEKQSDIDEENRIEGLVNTMSSLPIDEQYEINLVEYEKFIDYHNNKLRKEKIEEFKMNPSKLSEEDNKKLTNECSGKGYEIYLCTTGKSLIDKRTNSTSIIHNNDDNLLISKGLRKFASIDLYNDVAMIECKDFYGFSSTDDIPLQDTKLCGYQQFNIYFNENGKIIKFTENGKNVLPKSKYGRDYKVYYRLKDGLYEYNVTESIQEYIKELVGNQKNMEVYFDKKDIITGKIGTAKNSNGKRILFKNSESIYINKKYLYKIK